MAVILYTPVQAGGGYPYGSSTTIPIQGDGVALFARQDGKLADPAMVAFQVYARDEDGQDTLVCEYASTQGGTPPSWWHPGPGRYYPFDPETWSYLIPPDEATPQVIVRWIYSWEIAHWPLTENDDLSLIYSVDRVAVVVSGEILQGALHGSFRPQILVPPTDFELLEGRAHRTLLAYHQGDLPKTRESEAVLALLWTREMERLTRQRLTTVYEVLRVPSEAARVLWLPRNLWALDKVLDPQGTQINNAALEAFVSESGQHEGNPRLERVLDDPSIYTTVGAAAFYRGLSYRVAGVWGVTRDGDLEPPMELVQACARGMALSVQQVIGSVETLQVGPLASESTDSHAVSWAYTLQAAKAGMLGLLKDPLIRDALRLYTAPAQMSMGLQPAGDEL